MFNKKIRETPLVQGVANEFFKIQGDYFNDDRSFLATLRALLHRRSHDAVNLSIRTFNALGYKELTDANVIFHHLSPDPFNVNTLVIRSILGTGEDIENIFRLYDDPDSGFVKVYPTFSEAKDLRLFVQKRGKLNARFYISEESKKTLILCDGLSLSGCHLIQSLTPRLFPWFFSEVPLDETEISLLDSLTYRSAAEYERILAVLADRIDFRKYTIKRIVGDFDKIGRQEELEQTKAEIRRYQNELNSLRERYQRYITELDNLNIRLTGQEMAMETASDSSELVDYFTCNRNLMPVLTRDRRLEFTVKTFF